MPRDLPEDRAVPAAYREADIYFAHLHLLGARKRLKWLDQDDRNANETMGVALEADASATEACLALDHDRQLVLLNEYQRQALEDCVYALNRLVLEVQCELIRIKPIGLASQRHLVTYLLFWRCYQPLCFSILKLPQSMRVPTERVRLRYWAPTPRSEQDINIRYGEVLGRRLR